MWLGIGQIAVLLIAVMSCHQLGFTAMVVAFACVNILWLLAWQFFAYRLIGYRFVSMGRDLLPFMLIAIAVMVLTYLVTRHIQNIYILMVVRVIIAAALYAVTMKLAKAKIFEECIEFIRNLRHRQQ